MNIYIESNFVLELALLQEHYQSCDNILATCEAENTQLIIPAFCIAETYETLGRRAKDRKQLWEKLKSELKQLSRSIPYQEEINTLSIVISYSPLLPLLPCSSAPLLPAILTSSLL